MKKIPVYRSISGNNAHPESVKLEVAFCALVDDEDFDRMSQFIWHFQRPQTKGQAIEVQRSITKSEGKQGSVAMHREIFGAGPRERVYHLDGDGLNNQRSNLVSLKEYRVRKALLLKKARQELHAKNLADVAMSDESSRSIPRDELVPEQC
jgi:hypothetical protein